jgi:hypothetical protein
MIPVLTTEYTVMQFGLINAPATLQRIVNEVMRNFLDVFVIVYLYKILVFSTLRPRLEGLCSLKTVSLGAVSKSESGMRCIGLRNRRRHFTSGQTVTTPARSLLLA